MRLKVDALVVGDDAGQFHTDFVVGSERDPDHQTVAGRAVIEPARCAEGEVSNRIKHRHVIQHLDALHDVRVVPDDKVISRVGKEARSFTL